MGAKQSHEPRSVSMENPTPAGVLDISDDVVKRLKQGISQQGKLKPRTIVWNHSTNLVDCLAKCYATIVK